MRVNNMTKNKYNVLTYAVANSMDISVESRPLLNRWVIYKLSSVIYQSAPLFRFGMLWHDLSGVTHKWDFVFDSPFFHLGNSTRLGVGSRQFLTHAPKRQQRGVQGSVPVSLSHTLSMFKKLNTFSSTYLRNSRLLRSMETRAVVF
jgi:hypothetical protein